MHRYAVQTTGANLIVVPWPLLRYLGHQVKLNRLPIHHESHDQSFCLFKNHVASLQCRFQSYAPRPPWTKPFAVPVTAPVAGVTHHTHTISHRFLPFRQWCSLKCFRSYLELNAGHSVPALWETEYFFLKINAYQSQTYFILFMCYQWIHPKN